MKLLFKQRLFSWFDSYDIYDEAGQTVYTVKGQLSWGHCLNIYDARGNMVLTFLPKFEMYLQGQYIGCIRKELSLFIPRFTVECNGWQVEGDWFEWDYRIVGRNGQPVATVTKEILNWTDTYSIDVTDPGDALCALMLVLAIDAEKCSRKD